MRFQTHDIQLQKHHGSKIIWLSQRLIMAVCGVDAEYLRKRARYSYKKSVKRSYRHHHVLPVTGKSWRWAKISGKIYYDYRFISNRAPYYYRDRLGDLNELLASWEKWSKNNQKNDLQEDFDRYVEENYESFMSSYYSRPHTYTQQIALGKACAAFDYLIKKRNETELSLTQLTKKVGKLIKLNKISYLPSYDKTLRQKLALYNQGKAIVELIKLPRLNNKNAIQYKDKEVESWAINLRNMPQNFSNEYIIRKVQEMCALTDREVPSRRWFGQKIFEQPKVKFLTNESRFGKGSRLGSRYESIIPMQNALYSGDVWQIDATRMNLLPHITDANLQKHLFIIAVRDVHSGDVLGYNFDYKEDRWAIHNALKMAVEESGYLPYELVIDRYPGHNSAEGKQLRETLVNMGTKVTITHKATGKAGIERWFSTLQSVFMMDSDYYYGEGIKSRRTSAHRAPEYLKSMQKKARRDGFDLTASWNESVKIVEAYRNTALSYYSRKHRSIDKSPRLIHAESEKPNAIFLKDWEISMIFGLKKKLLMNNNGLLKTEIQKIEYYYQIDNYELISTYKEVILSYDLEDLSKVYLFTQHNHLLVHRGEANMFDKPQAYGPQAEFNKIAKAKQRIKEINEKRQAELDSLTQGGEEVALMLGRLTNKEEAESNESKILMTEQEIKPAVGAEFEKVEKKVDIDISDFVTKQF